MAGHFPFTGKANRVSVFAFYESHQLSLELQEKYYKWWYDWTKGFVQNDPDLRHTKASEFAHYPYGQHAHSNFHLRDYQWATALLDLGEFIAGTILPKLTPAQLHQLEEDHHHLLEALRQEREKSPRPAPPDIGRYRHT